MSSGRVCAFRVQCGGNREHCVFSYISSSQPQLIFTLSGIGYPCRGFSVAYFLTSGHDLNTNQRPTSRHPSIEIIWYKSYGIKEIKQK